MSSFTPGSDRGDGIAAYTQSRRLRSVKLPLPRSQRRVARFRWWLLPHIAYFGWRNRLVTFPARLLWRLTAFLPGSVMYVRDPDEWEEAEWDE